MKRRRQRGFSLFGLGLSTLLVTILVALLLKRLYYYQEVAEKARVELTLRAIGTALKLRMGQMMIGDKAYRWREIIAENPFDWFEKKPADYCGEVERLSSVEPGCWIYLRGAREVVYRVVNAGHLQTADDAPLLRYRVVARIDSPEPEEISLKEAPSAADTLGVEPVVKFRWMDLP
jgi:hypothetical protein